MNKRSKKPNKETLRGPSGQKTWVPKKGMKVYFIHPQLGILKGKIVENAEHTNTDLALKWLVRLSEDDTFGMGKDLQVVQYGMMSEDYKTIAFQMLRFLGIQAEQLGHDIRRFAQHWRNHNG